MTVLLRRVPFIKQCLHLRSLAVVLTLASALFGQTAGTKDAPVTAAIRN